MDGNTLAGTCMRIDNDEAAMTSAANLYMRDVKAINAYSDTNSRDAMGTYIYGAFEQIKLDKCSASNISRAAALTGSPASIGIGYGHRSVTSYARNVIITDPYIDTVTAADAVGDGTYVNMDGINVTGPAANANGGIKMDTTLIIRGGTFINCSGRSIKSQMESNLVDGPTFIRNSAMTKMGMASGHEVDFQYGSGVLTNFKVRYGEISGGGTPFPASWAICNATCRNYAAEEGALVVTNGEITNDVPQGTDLLPYFVTVSVTAGTFQSAIVENNSFLGAGAVDISILLNSASVDKVVANHNYFNDLGSSLVYGSADYSSASVLANGNHLDGTAKKITDGAAAVAQWWGLGNTGFNIPNANAAWIHRASANVTDGGTIAHNMGVAPTVVLLTPSIAGEMATVTSIDATNITVAIKKHDGSAGTQQTIFWEAFK